MSQERVEALMREGYTLLERMELDRAIEIGEELRSMHHSAAFDILAEAYAGKGQPQKAIEVLEEGVKAVPRVWLLWQSLGNMQAHTGHFARAHEAYGRALVCPDADVSAIHFNRALAYARQQDYGEALACLRLVDSDVLRFKAGSFMVAVLVDLGRHEEAAEEARGLLDGRPSGDPEDLARIHAHLARSFQARGDSAGARRAALEAIRATRWEPAAMFVLRQLDGRTSETSRYFRLLVDGREPDGRPFMATYDVVADTPEDAFRYARVFEGEGLELRDSREMERRPGVLHGVYGMTNHVAPG